MTMAWFQNFYQCDRCGAEWEGEWSCMVDDECPFCGRHDIAPYDANDLKFSIIKRAHNYVVLRSPDTAEHRPDYVEIAGFPTREFAEAYIIALDDLQFTL